MECLYRLYMLSAVKCFDRVCATEMTTEEKFRAAVNVIRNLPKNGKLCISKHNKARLSIPNESRRGHCHYTVSATWASM